MLDQDFQNLSHMSSRYGPFLSEVLSSHTFPRSVVAHYEGATGGELLSAMNHICRRGSVVQNTDNLIIGVTTFGGKLEIRQLVNLETLRCPGLIWQCKPEESGDKVATHTNCHLSLVVPDYIRPRDQTKPTKTIPAGEASQAGAHLSGGVYSPQQLITYNCNGRLNGCHQATGTSRQQPRLLMRPVLTLYNAKQTVCFEPLPVGGPLWGSWGKGGTFSDTRWTSG